MLVQTSSDSPDELLREMWKAEHIFRELGNQYQFSIPTASNLPLLVSSPLHIPEDRDFLCLFGCALNKDLSLVQPLYSRLEQRALSMKPNTADLFDQQECLCVETMAHFLRQHATVEPDAKLRRQLFDKAYRLYRSVIYTCSHSSLTAIVEDVKSMSKKISLVCPVPDMHRFSSEGRRRVAHCLAGMALCALMGRRDPMLCFGLSSAAVMWEPVRRLEMANFLRMNLLLVGRFHLGLCSVSVPGKKAGESWEFVTNSMETIDALMGFGGSTLVNVPAVYDAMNKQIVLPAVILHGSATMLERERELIQADDWEEAHRFALSVNKRMEDRTDGTIPDPIKLTHVHVVGGQFAERRCGGCGIWQSHTEVKLDRCSVCRLVYYCSKECQKKDWKAHKQGCKRGAAAHM